MGSPVGCCYQTRTRKGPADEEPAGPFRGEPYSGFSSSPSLDLSNGFAGSLVSSELGSKSTVPTGMWCFMPSPSSASPRRIGKLPSLTVKLSAR